MDKGFALRTAKVLVADPSLSRRQLIVDVVRSLGFGAIESVRSGKEALGLLEVESFAWIIMPLMDDEPTNALQVMKIMTEHRRLRRMRVSLVLSASDAESCLGLAFELGLLSWHPTGLSRDDMASSFRGLLARLEANDWNATLASAEYLREHLIARGHYKSLLTLQENLLDLHPGAPRLLLGLAEAQALGGKSEAAGVTLRQAQLLSPRLQQDAEHIARKYGLGDDEADADAGAALDDDSFDEGHGARVPRGGASRVNALGVETCVVVDPDSTVRYNLTNLLRETGAPRVEAFGDGAEAFEWLRANPEPSVVIQEWRIGGLTGPLLLQRLRQHGFLRVPIVVVSSLIQPHEVPLVHEMGVTAVLEKPFDQQAFFNTLVWTLQQNRNPTEQVSLERKMRQLLAVGHRAEAERLKEQYLADPRINSGGRQQIEAEFAFFDGQYVAAKEHALGALRATGDSLMLLNLLGKCLLKLGEQAAALKCFGKAQSLSPLNVERLCRIAEAQAELGQPEDAERSLAAARCLDAEAPIVRETECKAALVAGDVEGAREVIGQLDSMSPIFAFMNNRAIALARAGLFDEGLTLYKRTLAALPGEWSRFHDAVCYNMGLAHARYGDLQEALVELERVRQPESTPLRRKVTSLVVRIQRAVKTGGSLIFNETREAGPGGGAGGDPAAPPDPVTAAVDIVIDAARGDMCCHLIFRCMELADDRVVKLLNDLPPFTERTAISREEAFGHVELRRA